MPKTRKASPEPAKKKAAALLDRDLFEAAKLGDVEETRRLLDLGADPLAIRSCALSVAAARGNACATLLAPFDHPREVATAALKACAGAGLLDAVMILAPKAFLHDGSALQNAALRGRLDCVKFLAPLCRRDSVRDALVDAAQHGSPDCVEALALHAKRDAGLDAPAAIALEIAASKGCARSIAALLQACDPVLAAPAAMARAVGASQAEAVRLLAPFCPPHELAAWARESLFVARHRDGRQALEVLAFLAQKLSPAQLPALLERARAENNPHIDATLAPIALAAQESQALREATQAPNHQPQAGAARL